jgi:SSS family solute:Na+ symporter
MIQLGIVIVYSLAMIGVGIAARKKAGSPNGFFVAHRRVGLAFIAGSFVATAVGGSVTVGMAGLGFGQGLTGIWWLLVGSIGLVILGIFFARRVRRAALYTLPELVERQYDRRVGLAASILIVVAWVGVVAGQIVAAGKVMSILGMGSTDLWMVIFTTVFVAYTVIGGQLSVIRTDLFQAIVIYAGIFIVLALFLPQLGGLSGLRLSLPQDFFSFPVSSQFGWKAVLSLLILVGATYVVGPDIYSRLFCAKDERTAQRAASISAFSFLPLAFAVVLIGMGARVLYPQISPEQAFPQIISGILSPWLGGLVLAALIAALMSSADTCLLSQGVILTEDVIKRFVPSLSEKRTIWLTRLNIALLGGLALGLAMILKGVISSLLFAYTIFTCGLVVPVIVGFYKEKLKPTPQGALAALAGGGAIGLMGRIPGLDIPLKEDLGLIGFAVSAVLLFTVSYLARRSSSTTNENSALS